MLVLLRGCIKLALANQIHFWSHASVQKWTLACDQWKCKCLFHLSYFLDIYGQIVGFLSHKSVSVANQDCSIHR